MFKYNNDNIFTGYLKQLLASFNLPNCKIYTKADKKYFEKNHIESAKIIESVIRDKEADTLTRYIPYIRNDEIAEYINYNNRYEWHKIMDYAEGKYLPNYTKNYKITNNIYDTYTHEYLGDYLRFLRDYHNVDLMPLYNCFTDKICNNLDIKCVDNSTTAHFIFDSSDSNYKIYMLPVKLFQQYTIAIDSGTPIEICCGIYGKYQDTSDMFDAVVHDTYRKFACMKFNSPILYDNLNDLSKSIFSKTTLTRLAQKEKDLKMFIKVPVSNKSSIVVLEGNYIGWNDSRLKFTSVKNASNVVVNTKVSITKNKTITNFTRTYNAATANEYEKVVSKYDFLENVAFKPITNLQLLKLNTGISYPFSDALPEYLVGNAITSLDEIPDNIRRLQTVAANATIKKARDTADAQIESLDSNGDEDGIWDERIRALVYNYMMSNYTYKKNCADVLGYIDHRAEYLYNYTYKDSTGKVTDSATVANIDIYPDLYKDSK